MPLFFWNNKTLRRSPGKIYFSPGVPSWAHMTLCMGVNLGNIRYLGPRGDLEEKVERQGKGDQNVWNEPNDAPLSPWVHNMSCWEETPFSKLNIFKNDPYFKLFLQGESFQQKKANNCLFLRILSFEKGISAQQAMLKTQGLRGASLDSFQTFWSPFPWRSTFSSKSPLGPK